MRYKKPFYAVGLLAYLIGVSWIVYVILNPPQIPRPIEADMVFIHSLNKIVSNIYTTTGRPLRSQDDLAQSSYYPFSQVRSPNGGRVSLRLSEQKEIYEWLFVIAPTAKGTRMQRRWTETRLAPEKETHYRLSWLMLGTKKITQQVRDWREEIKKSWSILVEEKYDTTALSERSLPYIPEVFNRDAPLQAETYIRWLELIEGQTPLLDGWGRPFHFKPSRDFLTGMSAGIDGKLGTTDDIVVRTMLRDL